MTSHKFDPDYAVPPSETIREMLSERKWYYYRLAREMGIPHRDVIATICLDGMLTEDLCERLGRSLGTSKAFWLAREKAYRARLARERAAQSVQNGTISETRARMDNEDEQ